ncbi:MAG: flagellar FlbD family protein [Clostridiales bacterium]|nr:flagellar FlbD family protein [Clostridiales bacterium]
MLILTRLDGTKLMLNENMIEIAEETPDTVITMNNSHTYVVKESIDFILNEIKKNKQIDRPSRRRMT